jgi:Tol biopolymer transport system component
VYGQRRGVVFQGIGGVGQGDRGLGLVLVLVAVFGMGRVSTGSAAELADELKEVSHRILYETYRDGNWELFLAGADGSEPVNLTNTPEVDELNPHASPDGSKVCFVVDRGKGAAKERSVYYMKLDGTGRTLVAEGACWPCWKADGTAIAYLKNESAEFTYRDYATEGIFIYDLKTGEHREHANKDLHHLYNLCWSPDGRWFLATVHAGMGYKHAMLAIEAAGTKVYDLGLGGCRPDVSPDGKKVAWGPSDWKMCVADLDLAGPEPKATNRRDVVTSEKPMMIYHMEWSPDGKYIAFSRGPGVKRMGQHPAIIGIRAEGWNLGVADASATNRWTTITTDGNCNKEPDGGP